MGPSRGMSHPTATKGRMTPLFWGGSLTSPAIMRPLGRRMVLLKQLTTAE